MAYRGARSALRESDWLQGGRKMAALPSSRGPPGSLQPAATGCSPTLGSVPGLSLFPCVTCDSTFPEPRGPGRVHSKRGARTPGAHPGSLLLGPAVASAAGTPSGPQVPHLESGDHLLHKAVVRIKGKCQKTSPHRVSTGGQPGLQQGACVQGQTAVVPRQRSHRQSSGPPGPALLPDSGFDPQRNR